MNESFRISLFGIGINGGGIFDVILDEIVGGRDDTWSHVSAHDVDIGVLRVANGDVAVCIDDGVVVEDVVCCY